MRRAWEFDGSGILRSSIVAATTFWPAQGKRLTGCSGSPSPTICWCTSRARLRTLPPGGYGRSCSRICSSRTRRSQSSSSFILSSRSCASCAALSSCERWVDLSVVPSRPGVFPRCRGSTASNGVQRLIGSFYRPVDMIAFPSRVIAVGLRVGVRLGGVETSTSLLQQPLPERGDRVSPGA